jgi:polyphosphate glucokinase
MPEPRGRTLCFDIGGTNTKAAVFDSDGNGLSERTKTETPHRMRPRQALAILRMLAKGMPAFERISAGFPGVVKDGKTWSATNLGRGWVGFALRSALEREFGAPARVANDAAVQGLGVIRGKGTELILTFGTGLGSALYYQGMLIPNFQLGHHPFEKNETYEDLLGKRGIAHLGERRWNRRIRKAIAMLTEVFNWDYLYLGGGEAKRIRGALPRNVRVVSNEYGLVGGLKLWVMKR